MNTAANEWAARVAARNEVETAKARCSERRLALPAQPTCDWTGGGDQAAAAERRPLTQEQKDLRDSPLGMTLGLYR